MNPEKTYRTPDLNVSAWLVVKGHQLLAVEPGPKRSTFIFPAAAAQDVGDYHAGGLCVGRDLAQAIRELKNQVYAAPQMTNGNGDPRNDRPRRQQ